MKKLFLTTFALAVFGGPALAAEAGAKLRFAFGTAADEATLVAADATYSAERGFGFEPGAAVTSLASRGVTNAKPFLFSAKVPEGNYRVAVTLGDSAGDSNNTIKAESRRLM